MMLASSIGKVPSVEPARASAVATQGKHGASAASVAPWAVNWLSRADISRPHYRYACRCALPGSVCLSLLIISPRTLAFHWTSSSTSSFVLSVGWSFNCSLCNTVGSEHKIRFIIVTTMLDNVRYNGCPIHVHVEEPAADRYAEESVPGRALRFSPAAHGSAYASPGCLRWRSGAFRGARCSLRSSLAVAPPARRGQPLRKAVRRASVQGLLELAADTIPSSCHCRARDTGARKHLEVW